ncbi:3-dehydroquinate synthase [Corynebacterium sp. A21]|uniref:3-dehydroquinate synthase n=1 Tax=Corynebacterium sp. A21 TaxID=3457318 RepID=UPI003FD26AE2
MTIIDVNGPNPYQVHIDRGLNSAIADRALATGAAQVAIIHQPSLVEPVRELTRVLGERGFQVVPILVPDAEAGKGLEVAGQCWDALGQVAFGRRDVVIGFGGGAATDLAGFVAAAWMRGVKIIQVPTTLLAMVDAAVGGKTGINTAAGKNLVGAFHEPDSVFIDLDRLDTLPADEIVAGSAEIIKTGFIADPVILERYETDPAAALDPAGFLPELIARSVQVKAAVVGQDLKESGLRETLNYGHTFGHAVELRERYQWRHGKAVAVGLMFIAELAEINGLIDAELVTRHRAILSSVGLPTTYEAGVFDDLYQGMTRDKKNRDGNIRFVALTAVGETTRLEGPELSQLQEAYRRISEGA